MDATTPQTTFQVENKTITLTVSSGIVDKVSKRVETHINAQTSGSNTKYSSQTLRVSSSNTTVTELWMRDGDRELDHTIRQDLSVKENQRISIITASNGKKTCYATMVNHNSEQKQAISTSKELVQALIITKINPAIWFLVAVVTVFLWLVPLLGIIPFLYLRNQKIKRVSEDIDRQISALAAKL
jgi:hypothetical protein